MTFPSILFGIVVATFLGAIFHFWQGGKLGKLLYFVLISLIGFWVGHILAGLQGWLFGRVGPLNFGPAVLFAILFLIIGGWLGNLEIEKTSE